jgi:hypothetical protein
MSIVIEKRFHPVFHSQEVTLHFAGIVGIILVGDMARVLTTPFCEVPGHRTHHHCGQATCGHPDWVHGLEEPQLCFGIGHHQFTINMVVASRILGGW